jgi:hypothetical protein
MKKLLLILAIAASLVSCEKERPELGNGGRILPEWYFSKVRYFANERAGQTDTTWTLKMLNDSMRAAFAPYNGYVYEQSAQFVEIGRLWQKAR